MIANSMSTSRRTRLASATALLAAVAAGSTLAAPAASAAPVSKALVLTQAQFPAGSVDYRTGQLGGEAVSIKPSAPQQCKDAANRLNGATANAQSAAASARNGYSFMTAGVISPAQGALWRGVAQACSGRIAEIPVPGDLTRYNPAVITYGEDERAGAIEGAADVNGYTVNVYVRGLSETPANSARFWQVFRAQIQKIEAAR
ncbi:hypothetical protein [Tsukamurella paurometabola]|uniref:PknH-like extracellular domain-containing protein n=1 Tax=Tsukamurella paurometabola TaxID=2061 RepID=A0A3P8K8Z9_TSUPA|nr:hypothetical protein [Tsukamurella paurometabola]MBS4103738.1 hypothetical protein [Tsukamurella paurometabola]UEA84005.1 hypothetical protein LK411_03975 [Tsukamurella paurometabola]VDR41164.1 Uncharacterised protein [Tsukamurella paurometabola]